MHIEGCQWQTKAWHLRLKVEYLKPQRVITLWSPYAQNEKIHRWGGFFMVVVAKPAHHLFQIRNNKRLRYNTHFEHKLYQKAVDLPQTTHIDSIHR